jgi:SAM-dependent methyltransferase
MSEAASWDRRYASTDRLFSVEPDPSLVELVTPLTPGRAVDLGAGEGRNSLWLAGRGWDVTAVDASAVALGRLDDDAARAGLPVTTVVSDLTEYLTRGDRFDLVALVFIHPAPDDRDALLAAASSAVSDGGHLLVVGHHLDSLGTAGPPDPDRLYTLDALRGAFAGLELIELGRRHGPSDTPTGQVSDVVAWATRPAR